MIFLNIVASLPHPFKPRSKPLRPGIGTQYRIVVFLLVFLATTGIIFVQRSPMYSDRQCQRQIGGANRPLARAICLKLNAGGVMPIIFASALFILPVTLANVTQNEWLIRAASSLNPGAANPGRTP